MQLDAGIYYVEVRGHETGDYRVLAWGDSRKPCQCAPSKLPPSAPSNLTASAGDGEATLTWTASVEDGGSAVLRHEYQQRTEGLAYVAWRTIPDSAPGGINATRFLVTGLDNGVRVFFQVRATNAVGAGFRSEEAAATPAGVRFFAPRVITSQPDTDIEISVLHIADLDGDGDPDVLTSHQHTAVVWYENVGGHAIWTPRTIATTGAHDASLSAHAADLDGDGDTDVLSASESGLAWHENDGDAFSPRQIIAPIGGAVSVHAADLDGDGDADVVSGSRYDSTAAWYENLSDHGDDHGDAPASATLAATLPAFLHGVLESSGDRDVFRVATGNGTLRVRSNGPTDTFGTLLGADGGQLAASDGGGSDSNFAISAEVAAGAHHVEVRSAHGGTGAYTLSLSFDASGDHADSPEVATPVAFLPWSGLGELERGGDQDVFRVDVPESGVVTVRVDGGADTYLALTDVGGAILAEADNSGGGSSFEISADVERGTHYLELRGLRHRPGHYTLYIRFLSDVGRDVSFERGRIGDDWDAYQSIHAADLDGDGDPDLVSGIRWYENQGGAFPAQREIVTSGIGRPCGFHRAPLCSPVGHVADLDGDGDPDLLTEPFRGSDPDYKIAWHKNEGAGAFSAQQVIASDTGVRSAHAADLDGDGDVDLLASGYSAIWWYENEGHGEFSARRLVTASRVDGFSAHAADLDGDRDLDVISQSSVEWSDGSSYSYLEWHENYGGRAFSAPRLITGGESGPLSVNAADLDGDGDPDVAYARAGSAGEVVPAWERNLSNHGDDHGDAPTAATLAPVLPAFLHGVLESSGDRDVFRVATGNGKLRVRSNGPTDTFGTVLDADGSELAADDGVGVDSNFAIAAEVAAGAHYVEVRSVGGATGPYTLSISFAREAGSVARRVGSTRSHGNDSFHAAVPDAFGNAVGPSSSLMPDSVALTRTQRLDDGNQDTVPDDHGADRDGVSNAFAAQNGLSVGAGDASADTGGDGLSDLEELPIGIGPRDGASGGPRRYLVSYLPAAWTSGALGVMRVINHANRSGGLRIRATDDRGREFNAVPLHIGARQALEFDSGHLEIQSDPAEGLDLEVLAYVRTPDGILAPVHDTAPRASNVHLLPTFALGSLPGAEATLRVFNPQRVSTDIAIRGVDDQGRDSGAAHATVPAGEVRSFTATELEAGIGGVRGALGTAHGGWRLAVTSPQPIIAMGLLRSRTGHLASLATALRRGPDEAHLVPLFPRAGDRRGQGVLRAINHSARPRDLRVSAIDDLGRRYGPLTVPVPAHATVDFDAGDLERGNPDNGLRGGLGAVPAEDWGLELASGLDIEVVAYLRSNDGFVTPIQSSAHVVSHTHFVDAFNPATKAPFASSLRVVNPGPEPAVVTIRGIDDMGAVARTDVRLTVPGGHGRSLSAKALETGADDDRPGPCRLGCGERWVEKAMVGGASSSPRRGRLSSPACCRTTADIWPDRRPSRRMSAMRDTLWATRSRRPNEEGLTHRRLGHIEVAPASPRRGTRRRRSARKPR